MAKNFKMTAIAEEIEANRHYASKRISAKCTSWKDIMSDLHKVCYNLHVKRYNDAEKNASRTAVYTAFNKLAELVGVLNKDGATVKATANTADILTAYAVRSGNIERGDLKAAKQALHNANKELADAMGRKASKKELAIIADKIKRNTEAIEVIKSISGTCEKRDTISSFASFAKRTEDYLADIITNRKLMNAKALEEERKAINRERALYKKNRKAMEAAKAARKTA